VSCTSGYYAWRSRDPSARQVEDETLLDEIKTAYAEPSGNPGVRRMRAEMTARGRRVGHRRVHGLMRAAGLQCRHRTNGYLTPFEYQLGYKLMALLT